MADSQSAPRFSNFIGTASTWLSSPLSGGLRVIKKYTYQSQECRTTCEKSDKLESSSRFEEVGGGEISAMQPFKRVSSNGASVTRTRKLHSLSYAWHCAYRLIVSKLPQVVLAKEKQKPFSKKRLHLPVVELRG